MVPTTWKECFRVKTRFKVEDKIGFGSGSLGRERPHKKAAPVHDLITDLFVLRFNCKHELRSNGSLKSLLKVKKKKRMILDT